MHTLALLISILSTAPATTQAADAPSIIVVVGAEGTPEYGSQFKSQASRWREAAKRGAAHFVQIDAADSSQKQRLQQALEPELKPTAQPLWLVLIGHGTFDGRDYKFNLVGDDVSGAELAQWLANCERPLVVIGCTSASAPLLNALSGENRIIITATRSGSEIQFSRFGEYLASSIGDPSADLDKDGQTSLLEAFLAGSHGLEEFYQRENRLATEHALLDDNGDKLGTPSSFFEGFRATRAARDGAQVDGARAHQWHLVPGADDQSLSLEAKQRRDEIELQIESLRGRKQSMNATQYYQQLEPLLMELARLYENQPRSGATTRPRAASR